MTEEQSSATSGVAQENTLLPGEEASPDGAHTEARHWVGAAPIMLALHVGGGLWLLGTPAVTAADDMPPAAIMIDFADTPEAMATEETEITQDQKTSEASPDSPQVDVPDDVQPDQPLTAADDAASVTPETTLPVIEHAEAPLPLARPQPPEREMARAPTPQSRPRARQASAAVQQALRAQADVRPSNRTAARQTASGLASSAAAPAWQARLMAHLERRKRYPSGARARGEHGIVLVRFSLDEAGNVLTVSLARSSGFSELDAEVLSLVRRASPVPAPPPDANKTITAPVRFSAR